MYTLVSESPLHGTHLYLYKQKVSDFKKYLKNTINILKPLPSIAPNLIFGVYILLPYEGSIYIIQLTYSTQMKSHQM